MDEYALLRLFEDFVFLVISAADSDELEDDDDELGEDIFLDFDIRFLKGTIMRFWLLDVLQLTSERRATFDCADLFSSVSFSFLEELELLLILTICRLKRLRFQTLSRSTCSLENYIVAVQDAEVKARVVK